jgi:hypothetical protein
MKLFKSLLLVSCVSGLPLLAQEARFTGFVGAGPTVPTNPIGTHVDNGWNIAAGAGISTNHYGLMLDFMYNDMGINSNTLSQNGAPGGSARVWGFTLDPVVHLTQEGPADIYLTAGGGIYHRNVEFTQPGVAQATFFDPWFGFYPGLVGTNQVLASYSQYKGGVDGGIGMSVKLGSSRVKAFAEARYHYIFTNPVSTTIIPVTIGLRW